MQTIVNSCAGLDVHKMMFMVAIRKQTPEGIKEFTRQFGTFKRDREQLCAFLSFPRSAWERISHFLVTW